MKTQILILFVGVTLLQNCKPSVPRSSQIGTLSEISYALRNTLQANNTGTGTTGTGTTGTDGGTGTSTGTETGTTIAYVLPMKTGQTTSYSLGDDGQYQIGRARTYTDNLGGTITEDSSGLIWQKCSRGQTNNPSCSGSATTANWTTAGSYCTGLILAGKTWRLPTMNELANLVDYSRSSPPSVNTTFFPATVANYYWSFSTYSLDTTNAWLVNFNLSDVINLVKTDNYYVRCISGTNNTPSTIFTDNSNGTVTDQATGLIWQKCSAGLSGTTCETGSAGIYTWTSALSYCNSLSLASRTWRLPNVNELRTIIDLTRTSSPSIDTTAFPATDANSYWSSTTYAPSTTLAWQVNFNSGYVVNDFKTIPTYVRCVSGQ
ncbi:MAG: DUF1566 domain-containing protein [Leptospiraceae bacterium]|nr:DUF1566 domain-containing protein [Leptospiraceae bacterium]